MLESPFKYVFSREFLLGQKIEYALTRHEDVIFLQRVWYLAIAHKFSIAKRIYERKKYPEIIPLELYREL